MIFYLGGSPCSGKSSVAEQLAARFGLNHVRLDDQLFEHIQAASTVIQPTLASLRSASCDEIWMIPPIEQARRTICAYVEEFPLHHLESLRQPIIVEGAALLPLLVAPRLDNPRQAFFMVPTPAFQREHYRLRTWVSDVLSGCNDPQQAFENWMRRDEIFGRWVRGNAYQHGLNTMIVNGEKDIDETIEFVARYFSLPLD